VASAIIMEVPLVDKVEPGFYAAVTDGVEVEVDADNGLIVVAGQAQQPGNVKK